MLYQPKHTLKLQTGLKFQKSMTEVILDRFLNTPLSFLKGWILVAKFLNFQILLYLIFKTCRSSRSKVFCKKGVLTNFAKFTGKHLCQSLFFNKVPGRLQLYLKRDSSTGVFL